MRNSGFTPETNLKGMVWCHYPDTSDASNDNSIYMFSSYWGAFPLELAF